MMCTTNKSDGDILIWRSGFISPTKLESSDVIVGGDNKGFYSMHEKGTVVFDHHVVYSDLLDTLKFQRVAEEVPKGIVAADWRKETLGYGNVHEERVRDGKKR